MNAEKTESVNNHVVAVLDDDSAAKAAAKDLQAAGFTQASLFRGEEVADTLDPKGEKSGPIAKVIKLVQDHLSEEPNYLAQYQEEARAGKDVVAVPVDDEGQAEEVQDILKRHGAHNVRYFGTLAVHDLTPESNPTPRSEESAQKTEL